MVTNLCRKSYNLQAFLWIVWSNYCGWLWRLLFSVGWC